MNSDQEWLYGCMPKLSCLVFAGLELGYVGNSTIEHHHCGIAVHSSII